MAEEEYLIQELRKIETRKKEREKKAQDLQKLITAADTTTEMRRAERKATKKKLPQKREMEKPVIISLFTLQTVWIKFLTCLLLVIAVWWGNIFFIFNSDRSNFALSLQNVKKKKTSVNFNTF